MYSTSLDGFGILLWVVVLFAPLFYFLAFAIAKAKRVSQMDAQEGSEGYDEAAESRSRAEARPLGVAPDAPGMPGAPPELTDESRRSDSANSAA